MTADGNKIKAIFFDVDGTLFSHRLNDVPESTRRALKALRERGVLTVVATGRHMIEYSQLPVGNIEFDGYLTLNGQLLLDSNRKVYAGTAINEGEMKVLAGLFFWWAKISATSILWMKRSSVQQLKQSSRFRIQAFTTAKRSTRF